jgi:hypothetical protein
MPRSFSRRIWPRQCRGLMVTRPRSAWMWSKRLSNCTATITRSGQSVVVAASRLRWRGPPSPPSIFDSSKVIQRQVFLEPPGKWRWSTTVEQLRSPRFHPLPSLRKRPVYLKPEVIRELKHAALTDNDETPGARPEALGDDRIRSGSRPPLQIAGRVDCDWADLSGISPRYFGSAPNEADRVRFREPPADLQTIENFGNFASLWRKPTLVGSERRCAWGPNRHPAGAADAFHWSDIDRDGLWIFRPSSAPSDARSGPPDLRRDCRAAGAGAP